jgi:hypothetical protein
VRFNVLIWKVTLEAKVERRRPEGSPQLLEAILDDTLPEHPKNQLVKDVRFRVLSAASQETESIGHKLLLGLNGAIHSRWELAYYKKHWPKQTPKTTHEIKEALVLVDRLLIRLVASINTFDPKQLEDFILPEGVPAGDVDQALGPIKRKIAVVGALGRATDLPQLPGAAKAI